MTTTLGQIGETRGRRRGLSILGTQAIPDAAMTDVRKDSRPVAVYTSFVVSPNEIDVWVGIWKRMARNAERRSGCRSFRIVQDRNDKMFVAAISEWDNIATYNRFVHKNLGSDFSNMMGPICTPSECRFMDIISPESTLSGMA